MMCDKTERTGGKQIVGVFLDRRDAKFPAGPGVCHLSGTVEHGLSCPGERLRPEAI